MWTCDTGMLFINMREPFVGLRGHFVYLKGPCAGLRGHFYSLSSTWTSFGPRGQSVGVILWDTLMPMP